MNKFRTSVALSLLIACAPAPRLQAMSVNDYMGYAAFGIQCASLATLAWGMLKITSLLSDIRDQQEADFESMQALMNECPMPASFACSQAVAEHLSEQSESLQRETLTYTQTYVVSKDTEADSGDTVDFIVEDEDDNEFEDEELDDEELDEVA